MQVATEAFNYKPNNEQNNDKWKTHRLTSIRVVELCIFPVSLKSLQATAALWWLFVGRTDQSRPVNTLTFK